MDNLPYENKEGGYQGWTIDTYDLLMDEVGELPNDDDESLFHAIHNFVDFDLWCKKDPFTLAPLERMRMSWDRFCDIVKYRRRYFFGDAYGSRDTELDDPHGVLRRIVDYAEEVGLIRTIGVGWELYRVRPENGDAPFRVFFEVMGFWTPEYVEKKLARLDALEDVEMLVAVDESLGVGDEIEATDNRAIPYSGTVSVKDVRDALRPYEERLVRESAAEIPSELRPDAAVVSIADLAAEYGVSEDALEDAAFPAHERVGRTLVAPDVLDELAEQIEPGMAYETASERLAAYGIADDSAALARLGYRVAWEGLGSGTIEPRE